MRLIARTSLMISFFFKLENKLGHGDKFNPNIFWLIWREKSGSKLDSVYICTMKLVD